ncbi:MAG: hypothetical protein HQL18_02840 [Candidatus Omnitrophica bacterium]|nr:hypothetical protein [Candidatus Omnitrophota bacterium]
MSIKKKLVLFILGFGLVIGGVALALKYWIFIKVVFCGLIGPLLAVGGLVLLAIARD